MMLEDDFAADLELAMLARRAGLPGAKTPKGILTAMQGTRFDALIRRVEEQDDPALVDLGMLLLQVSGKSATAISDAIVRVVGQTRADARLHDRSEEHTSELQSLMRISYAVFCLKQKNNNHNISC